MKGLTSIRKRIIGIVIMMSLSLALMSASSPECISEAASFENDPLYGLIWSEEDQQNAIQGNRRNKSVLDEYYRYAGYQNTAEYYFTTHQDSAYSGNLSLIYNKTDELIREAESDREKAKAIHDWISKNIKFSDDNSYDGSDISHPCADPFAVWENKSAVCWGYANLTDLMMQHAGINCVVVRGNTPQGSHVWNATLIDDKWYYLDNTWDANYCEQTGTLSYTYFLKDVDVFSKNHFAYILESCGGDSYSWVVLTNESNADRMIPVIFDPNGGTVAIEKALMKKDSGVNYIPSPVRDGFVFDGWYTSKSGGNKLTRSGETNLYIYEPEQATTIYAHWVSSGTETVTQTGTEQEEFNESPVPNKANNSVAARNVIVDLPAVKIAKPKAAKKAMTVKWKKVSKKNRKKIAKIQIQYSTSKNFKKGVKTVAANKTKASKRIKKLKSKKTYYVRVRAYKKVGNVVHVSKWSAAKRVKVK